MSMGLCKVLKTEKQKAKNQTSYTCPGTVDQKKPRQSGSSKMYGNSLVNNLTQFRTEKDISYWRIVNWELYYQSTAFKKYNPCK